MNDVGVWARYFAFGLAVEVPLFVLLAWRLTPWWRAALAGAACTCVTHPLLWYVWLPAFADYHAAVVSGEILVALVEWLVFFALARPVPLLRALAASLIANGASLGLGWLMQSAGLL